MPATDKPDAPNQTVLLQVNGDLLDQASKSGIDLSSTLEQALVQAIQARQGEQWLSENHDALAEYKKHVEEHGVISDGMRGF